MRSKLLLAIISISVLTIVLLSNVNLASTLGPMPSDLNNGPFVDRVIYKVISNQDQRILALQADEIEIDTNFFDPVYLPQLDSDPDIDIYSTLRNGYAELSINCRDYPLNYSVLRRAFAYAFDKTRVTTEILDGFAQEHDSVVPYPNSWCIEDDFAFHYYTDQSLIGNALLDAAGFDIDGGTGFRLTPSGDAFDIEVLYPITSTEIGGGVAQIAVDALTALHIDATEVASDFNSYMAIMDAHGSYDMAFLGRNFYDNDIDWLAYDFWSGYASTPYQNPTNFANATYDSWRDQLLYASTYEDVYDAAATMQEILQYNVPKLIVYENTYFQAYRNDEFTGFIDDFSRYASGLWTMRKVHRLDGVQGGTFNVALAEEPDSFNFFVTSSAYSRNIIEEFWPSLYKTAPDLTPWPDLAQSLLIETHSDNPAVPSGHIRFTIDIIQNATWSDGVPLTAEDVAFSFTYMVESGVYGNPYGADLSDLVAAYAPTPYRVILEFGTESYWQFTNFAFDYIIPEHIFNDDDGIGYENWNIWNPVFDPEEPHVTCGPFVMTDMEAGEFYEISRNPLFHWFYMSDTSSSSTTTTTSSPPVVLAASGSTYTVGTTGHYIHWYVNDDDPALYALLIDGELNDTGVWDGSNFAFNVDGHPIGTYNYTLVLYDYSLNMVSSSVLVTVLEETTTTTTTDISTTTGTSNTTSGNTNGFSNLTLIISIGSIVIIVIVVVLIIKQR